VVQKVRLREKESDAEKECGETPHAVIPLGDLESFMVNYTPNSALGKKHKQGRRPGYTNWKQRENER